MFRFNLILGVVLLQVMFLSAISGGKVKRAVETIKKDTSDWKTLVEDLKEKLSSDIDPCKDFYSYVCKKHNDEESYDFKNTLILEPYLAKGEGLSEPELKAKHYMHSCMHKTDEDIEKFVKNFNFEKSIGGWPAFDPKWDSKNFNWQLAFAEFASYNIWLPIDLSIMNSDFHNLKKHLYVRVQTRYFYIFDDEQAQFRLNQTLGKVGVQDVNAVLSDARQFENEYKAANIYAALDAPSVLTNFSSLKYEISELDWDKYFETTEKQKLPDDFTVELVKGDVLKKALATISKMDPKVFVNYLFCQLLLDLPFKEIQLSKAQCWGRTYDSFRTVLSQTVLKKFVSEQVRGKVLPLLQAYIDTLYKYLPPPETAAGMRKPKYIKQILEDYLASLTDASIIKEYKDLVIDPDSYLLNYYTTSRLHSYKQSEKRWNENVQRSANIEEMVAEHFPYQIYKVNTKPWTSVFSYIAFDYFAVRVHLEILNRHLSNSLSDCFDDAADKGSVADAITLQILTKTFNDWIAKNEGVIKADNDILGENGLNLKKALFISIMQFWCGGPNSNEVISMFSKFKEFGDAFNCPAGTPMNPSEKCDINKFQILA